MSQEIPQTERLRLRAYTIADEAQLFDVFAHPYARWLTDQNYAQWEFIRLVMKESPTAWWDADPLLGLPGWAFVGWAGTAIRSRLENLWGGPVSQNIGAHYTLTDEEKAYLATLGVNADELLAWMNAHTNIAASPPPVTTSRIIVPTPARCAGPL